MDWDELKYRRGAFYIALADIHHNLPFISRIMSNVIILGCTTDFSTDLIEYRALSALFDPVVPGVTPPVYQFSFDEFHDLACRQIEKSSVCADFVSGDCVAEWPPGITFDMIKPPETLNGKAASINLAVDKVELYFALVWKFLEQVDKDHTSELSDKEKWQLVEFLRANERRGSEER